MRLGRYETRSLRLYYYDLRNSGKPLYMKKLRFPHIEYGTQYVCACSLGFDVYRWVFSLIWLVWKYELVFNYKVRYK